MIHGHSMDSPADNPADSPADNPADSPWDIAQSHHGQKKGGEPIGSPLIFYYQYLL